MSVDSETIRKHIITSLFSSSSKGSAGQTGQSYISHCKTWEDVSTGERKPRYILLAVGPSGQVFLHKSKRNSNGSFSIGKTWDVIDLRGVELINDSVFKLSLGSRSYTWMAEDVYERAEFVNLLVRSFRQSANGKLPSMIGLPDDDYTIPAYAIPSSAFPSSPSHAPVIRSGGHPSPSSAVSAARSQPSSRKPVLSSQISETNSIGSSIKPFGTPTPLTPTRSEAVASRATSVEPHTSPSRASSSLLPRFETSSQRSRTPDTDGDSIGNRRGLKQMTPVSPRPLKFNKNKSSANNIKETASPTNRLISSPLRSTNEERPSTGSSLQQQQPPTSSQSTKKTSRPISLVGASSSHHEEGRTRRGKSSNPADEDMDITMKQTVNQEGEEVEPTKGTVEAQHDILANVEEMLEGFEWRMIGTGVEGVDLIEERLLNELKALELAEIHAIIENDDRVDLIGKSLDDGLAQLDKMEAMLSLYRTQLNLVSDEVTHIEGQNRGLQVQISNQRSLLEEIEELMQTVHIPRDVLDSLVREPLDKPEAVHNLEKSITMLYKAILSVRDMGNAAAVAASDDPVDEYKRDAKQFCKRVYEFLAVMFKYESEKFLKDSNNETIIASLSLPSHEPLEKYLGTYCGLTLFMKELDEARYQQLCAAYFATFSDMHKKEISALFEVCRTQIRKPTEEELEATFAASVTHSPTNAKTSAARNPLARFDRRDKKDASGAGRGEMTAGKGFEIVSVSVLKNLEREQNFVRDLLNIQSTDDELDNMITFADYADLEGYFRKAALAGSGLKANKFRDILSVMDLIFGFLPGVIKDWIESFVARDPLQMVSVLAALDTTIKAAQQTRNEYWLKTLEVQHRRSMSMFEKYIKDQLKAIETTKLTVKKRKGVVGFIATFPDFVIRVERQMEVVDDETNPTRKLVDKVYGQIVQSMFEALQTMAKSDEDQTPAAGGGGGNQEDRDKDKDRLNYHTLIIENMHHFVTTASKVNVSALKFWLEKAKEQYDQNLNLYIRLVLRRPLARLIDFFEGIQQLLRTTSPSEISMHSQYTKSALKRALSSFDKKDLKKSIEALGKRVEKHFNDLANPSAVMNTVWSACEAELRKWIEEWNGVIVKCYGAETHGLEIGVEDVKVSFLKYKPEHSSISK
ncbi:exocyst complex component Sec3-domain-containing protein [Melampsora americana]|nr:exocyst complex component Sec3-domain-containing protein [Melampsora americana]